MESTSYWSELTLHFRGIGPQKGALNCFCTTVRHPLSMYTRANGDWSPAEVMEVYLVFTYSSLPDGSGWACRSHNRLQREEKRSLTDALFSPFDPKKSQSPKTHTTSCYDGKDRGSELCCRCPDQPELFRWLLTFEDTLSGAELLSIYTIADIRCLNQDNERSYSEHVLQYEKFCFYVICLSSSGNTWIFGCQWIRPVGNPPCQRE